MRRFFGFLILFGCVIFIGYAFFASEMGSSEQPSQLSELKNPGAPEHIQGPQEIPKPIPPPVVAKAPPELKNPPSLTKKQLANSASSKKPTRPSDWHERIVWRADGTTDTLRISEWTPMLNEPVIQAEPPEDLPPSSPPRISALPPEVNPSPPPRRPIIYGERKSDKAIRGLRAIGENDLADALKGMQDAGATENMIEGAVRVGVKLNEGQEITDEDRRMLLGGSPDE